MKFFFVAFISILLLALSMHTLLQFVSWEVAMRIIGISMSVLAASAAYTFLPKDDQGELS